MNSGVAEDVDAAWSRITFSRSRHRGDPGETLAGAECNGVRITAAAHGVDFPTPG